MLDTRRAHCRVPRGRVSGFHLRKKGIWDKEGGEDEKEKDAKRVLQHDHAGSRHARVEMGDNKWRKFKLNKNQRWFDYR